MHNIRSMIKASRSFCTCKLAGILQGMCSALCHVKLCVRHLQGQHW